MYYFPDLWKGYAGVYLPPQPCSPAQALNFPIILVLFEIRENPSHTLRTWTYLPPFSFMAPVFFHGINFVVSWAAGSVTLFFLVTNQIVPAPLSDVSLVHILAFRTLSFVDVPVCHALPQRSCSCRWWLPCVVSTSCTSLLLPIRIALVLTRSPGEELQPSLFLF